MSENSAQLAASQAGLSSMSDVIQVIFFILSVLCPRPMSLPDVISAVTLSLETLEFD
jgi:hypothetical protein